MIIFNIFSIFFNLFDKREKFNLKLFKKSDSKLTSEEINDFQKLNYDIRSNKN